MSKKTSSIFLILLLGFTFITTINGLNHVSEFITDDLKSNQNLLVDDSNEIQELASETQPPINPPIITPEAITMYNNTKYYGGISVGQNATFSMEIPSESGKIYIEMSEFNNPSSVDIDLYIGFNFEPDLTTYHDVSATSSDLESITIVPPWEHQYGTMYVWVYCVSGSDSYFVRAYYIADDNGCWRTADEITTPTNGGAPISVSSTLSEMDLNDFYKMYLYSGQNITITGTSTPDAVYDDFVDMYLWDEDITDVGHDWSGTLLDINYIIEIFDNGYYYLQFNYGDSTGGIHSYDVDITDDNPDTDNRFDGPGVSEMTTSDNYYDSMDSTDYNDYWSFEVDSGENITIEITITDPLDSPHYNAYIFPGNIFPPVTLCLVNATTGTTLSLEFCCGEQATSLDEPNNPNTFYLRVWNEALCGASADPTSSYSVSFARDWINDDDRRLTAPNYVSLGPNSTSLKWGELSGQWDVNDYFKITTKIGYHIRISVETNNTPVPYLDGFLYDSGGLPLANDFLNNISISFIAPYTGDYYFRIYEGPASIESGSYYGSSFYKWMIYTGTADNSNDDINGAETIVPPFSHSDDLSTDDYSDYYQFDVPIGYEISIIGTSSEALDIFLYDEALFLYNYNHDTSWTLTNINRKCSPQTYTLLINNTDEHEVSTYNMLVLVTQIDADGMIGGANQIPITLTGSEQGTDSLGASDIRDYHYFSTNLNYNISITVEGFDGVIVSIIQNVSNVETVLYTMTFTGSNTFEVIFNSNESLTSDYKFYLRLCDPGGYPDDYSWSVTVESPQTPTGTNPSGLELWMWLVIVGGSVLIVSVVVVTVVVITKKKGNL